MKKRLALLLALAMTASAVVAGCGSSSDSNSSSDENTESQEQTEVEFKEKEAGDTFTVGFDQDFPPMGFVGDDGEFTGFDLELAQAVCDKLELEFVAEPIS